MASKYRIVKETLGNGSESYVVQAGYEHFTRFVGLETQWHHVAVYSTYEEAKGYIDRMLDMQVVKSETVYESP